MSHANQSAKVPSRAAPPPAASLMSNTSSYYVSGPARGEKVRELFDRIAPRYDLINDLQSFGLHRYWKAELVRMSAVSKGEKVLDLCTGTGDLAIRMDRIGAAVTACDFSQAMLERAKARAPHIHWVQGDALHLPFADNSFDLVTIGYGLRNLPNFGEGIHEMARVLRPGGRLLILEFGKPRNPLWRVIYFSYLKLFTPLLGLIFCGNRRAYSYILESLQHYPGEEGIEALLREVKLQKVSTRRFLGGVMSIQSAAKP